MFRLGVEVCQIFPVHLEIFWISGRSWMKKTADNRLVTSGLSWSNHYQTPHLLLRSPKRTLARSIAAFGHQQHRPAASAVTNSLRQATSTFQFKPIGQHGWIEPDGVTDANERDLPIANPPLNGRFRYH
jgi:hypothetical protein